MTARSSSWVIRIRQLIDEEAPVVTVSRGEPGSVVSTDHPFDAHHDGTDRGPRIDAIVVIITRVVMELDIVTAPRLDDGADVSVVVEGLEAQAPVHPRVR